MSALPIGPVTFVLAQKYESLTHETTIGIVLSLVVSVFILFDPNSLSMKWD